MEDELRYDLAGLVHLPRTHVTTRELIPPVIYRLAPRRRWDKGEVPIMVRFRPGADEPVVEHRTLIGWDLAAISEQYHEVSRDLRQIAETKNEVAITELAAIGIAFVLVTTLLPEDTMTHVVPITGRGDYFLNSRPYEMIEISGTLSGPLNRRFELKRAQICRNRSLKKAWICVSQFKPPLSRLERVR